MKRFFVAVCCTLVLGISTFAQAQEIVAPVTPGEDVAVAAQAAVAPVAVQSTDVIAPVASIVEGSIAPVAAQGCGSCGGSVVTAPFASAPSYAPVASQGCNTCGSTVVAAPRIRLRQLRTCCSCM